MQLSHLLPLLQPRVVTGDVTVEIRGVSYNSRTLVPGDVFVAISGTHVDGHRYVTDAVARGANAVVVEQSLAGSVVAPLVEVSDTRLALAQIAAELAHQPARRLWLAGITGTDGKTTSTELTAQLMQFAGMPVGFMSTVTLRTDGNDTPNLTRQTTLEAVEIQQGLERMLAAGRYRAILEVTSHALALRKLEGCAFDVVGVTNVTHDHLDFHGSWENYLRAKGHLLELLATPDEKPGSRTAILNRDDRSYTPLLDQLPAHARSLSYGYHGNADVQAADIRVDGKGASFTLRTPWGHVPVRIGLVGLFNVSNALLATTICLAGGIDLRTAAAGLQAARPVAGRMERIDEGQPFAVVVDYAHTPDSLCKVLTVLRQAAGNGRIIVVFGSAGERDTEKRPVMGEIAAEQADFAVFTTEDPRFEDPMAIIEQIARGAASAGKHEGVDYLLIEDRRAAIAAALDRARAGDVVLLAGKGHEQCIIVGTTKVPWDDRTVAAELIRERFR